MLGREVLRIKPAQRMADQHIRAADAGLLQQCGQLAFSGFRIPRACVAVTAAITGSIVEDHGRRRGEFGSDILEGGHAIAQTGDHHDRGLARAKHPIGNAVTIGFSEANVAWRGCARCRAEQHPKRQIGVRVGLARD